MNKDLEELFYKYRLAQGSEIEELKYIDKMQEISDKLVELEIIKKEMGNTLADLHVTNEQLGELGYKFDKLKSGLEEICNCEQNQSNFYYSQCVSKINELLEKVKNEN